jgi:hypothetical protein
MPDWYLGGGSASAGSKREVVRLYENTSRRSHISGGSSSTPGRATRRLLARSRIGTMPRSSTAA